jgi:PAS domain S-box-containing protein
VAVNQGAIGLHEARTLSEQKRAAEKLEQKVGQRTAELADLNEKLKVEIAERERAERAALVLGDESAAELVAMTRLHEFSTRLLATTDLQPVLEEVLDATMELLHADFGKIQLYNAQTRGLEIVVQRGFQQEFLDYFDSVNEGTASCGAALQRRERVIVEDVRGDPLFAPHQQIVDGAGYRAVQSTPLFTRSGEPLGMISTHFRQPHRPSERELRLLDLYAVRAAEVIELKRADEALRQSEERFRLMVEGVQDYAIFLLDPEGRVTTWNAGAERIKGYRQEEIVGRHFSVFYPDEDVARNKPAEQLRLAAATGRSVDEGWRVRNDGSKFWASVLITALRNGAGEIIGFSKLTRDISERKRAEEELQAAQAELARVTRLTTMGELTASIAHEVNQPLAAVVTNANAGLRWLAAALPNLDEARQAFQRIIRDGKRAGDVIARIRALAEKTATDKEPLELNQVVQEVLGLTQTEIRRNAVAVRTELAAGLPPVLGDRVQLQQVLLNLLINGIEAMHAVTDRPRQLLISSGHLRSDEVFVAVRDCGTGLDWHGVEKIFTAFYTTKRYGLGIGLSISYSIIEAHNGRLWAARNDGPGATFQFSLPAYNAAAQL